MTNYSHLKSSFLAKIVQAESESQLEQVRVELLGKNGALSLQLKQLGQLPAEERQESGRQLNEIKAEILQTLTTKKAAFEAARLKEKLQNEQADITLPVRRSPFLRGRLHPITQIIDEVSAIFASFGFSMAEGPDIESDYYNFTALNFPEDHPAREMHDTFFLKKTENEEEVKLLRTHTSPVQIRTMEKQSPPFRILMPGRTYRKDSDATHSPMFHQLEGLVIDKTATMAEMMWVLEEFCKRFFELPSVRMRFRPSFFPFTEPSMEVDIQCSYSKESVIIGTGEDWLEVLGCGMVHPNVLRAGGIDPDIYQGFAWGIGLDRLAMLKYGMSDLRAFFEGDLRWLKHYGFVPFSL